MEEVKVNDNSKISGLNSGNDGVTQGSEDRKTGSMKAEL